MHAAVTLCVIAHIAVCASVPVLCSVFRVPCAVCFMFMCCAACVCAANWVLRSCSIKAVHCATNIDNKTMVRSNIPHNTHHTPHTTHHTPHTTHHTPGQPSTHHDASIMTMCMPCNVCLPTSCVDVMQETNLNPRYACGWRWRWGWRWGWRCCIDHAPYVMPRHVMSHARSVMSHVHVCVQDLVALCAAQYANSETAAAAQQAAPATDADKDDKKQMVCTEDACSLE